MDSDPQIETTLLELLWSLPERCPERTLDQVTALLASRQVQLCGNLRDIEPEAILACLPGSSVRRAA
jgi:hypothetical protein